MRAVVAAKALAGAARLAASAVKRSTVAVLEHLRVAVGEGAVWLTGTDLDQAVTARAEADVSTAGVRTAPAASLARLLRRLPSEDVVVLEGLEGGLAVECGAVQAVLPSLPAEEFPDVDVTVPEGAAEISGAALADALGIVEHTISHEETRYYLNGVHMRVAGGRLLLVATDGHRLAEVALDTTADLPEDGVIVPAAAIALLRRMAEAAGEEPVRWAVHDQRFVAEAGDQRIVSRLIDGTFPAYERVIPERAAWTRLDRRALLEAAHRVLSLAPATRVAMVMEFAPDAVEVSIAGDTTRYRETMPCETGPQGLRIGFNPGYVRDAMSALPGEVVEFGFGGPAEPVPMRVPDVPLRYVLMPMRI